MLVRIDKKVNSSYRNIMEKTIFIETNYIETMIYPGQIKMVSGATHGVSKEDFDFVFNIVKSQPSTVNGSKV